MAAAPGANRVTPVPGRVGDGGDGDATSAVARPQGQVQGQPRWLDDEEMRAWRGLIELTGDVRAALDAELAAGFGMDEGDYAVLVNLSEAPERRMRMCDLAGRLHLSPSGLTRRLDGLVRDGLVARQPSPDDRRVSLAVLTDDGFARLEEAAPVHVDGVRRHLLDHLTRAQIRQLGAAFAAVQRRRAGSGDTVAR